MRMSRIGSPYWYLDTTDLMNGGTKVGPKAAKGSGPGMLQVLWIEVAQPWICIRQNGRWCLCRSNSAKQSVQRALQQNHEKWGRCRICEEPFRPCGEDTWRVRLHPHSYYNPNDKRVVTMGGNWGCGNCWGLLTTCWLGWSSKTPFFWTLLHKRGPSLRSLHQFVLVKLN